jgi:hypothetical protein
MASMGILGISQIVGPVVFIALMQWGTIEIVKKCVDCILFDLII